MKTACLLWGYEVYMKYTKVYPIKLQSKEKCEPNQFMGSSTFSWLVSIMFRDVCYNLLSGYRVNASQACLNAVMFEIICYYKAWIFLSHVSELWSSSSGTSTRGRSTTIKMLSTEPLWVQTCTHPLLLSSIIVFVCVRVRACCTAMFFFQVHDHIIYKSSAKLRHL